MIDVLHITSATNHGRIELGGAELALAELAGRMSREPDFDVAVAGPGEILERLAIDERVKRFHFDPFRRPALGIWRILRERRPDVVVTHLLRPTLLGQPLAALARVPVRISFLQNSLTRTYGAEPPGRLRRLAYELSFTALMRSVTQATVAVSDRNVEDLRSIQHVPPRRIRLIPNWVGDEFDLRQRPRWRAATRELLGLDDGTPLIGVVGRLEAQKRQELAIELLAQLPGAHLLIVGSGSREHALRAAAATAGVAERVVFAGFQPSVAEWIAACDVIAVPSIYEGMGRIAAESLGLGIPVVASDVDGLPFVLSAAPAGGSWLVAPDDRAAWRSALEGALARAGDATLAAALAAYAHERFGAAPCVAAWSALCRELAAGLPPDADALSWPRAV